MILILNFGCSGQSENSNNKVNSLSQDQTELTPQKHLNSNRIQNLKQLSIIEKTDTYGATKRSIQNQRSQLKSINLRIDSVGEIFKESLLNKIIPFWEGTEWSFEGHTSKPKSGKIACGYFVSTTLQDIGLNLNRYKLAKQSPINEARSLSIDR